MKRFITLAVAAILGLASAQSNIPVDPTDDGHGHYLDWYYKSGNLTLPWDSKYNIKGVSCNIYNKDLAVFDLKALKGPYYFNADVGGDAGTEALEVRFCSPVKASNLTDSKSSLIFVRNESATEVTEKRIARLTSGSGSFVNSVTIRNAD
jgi:hypothetical protein